MKMSRREFEKLVVSIIKEIPRVFREKMENIEVVIERFPSNELISEMGLKSPYELLGLYQGIPLNQRGFYYGNVLPDKITLFQGSIESSCKSRKEIKGKIKEVILHELGHYLGLDDSMIGVLEEN